MAEVNEQSKNNKIMTIIDAYIEDLKDTWGYETEELSHIRDQMEELANSCFWEGYNEAREDTGTVSYKGMAYGKKSDNE